jgi:outer membrane protein assembly factor BamB
LALLVAPLAAQAGAPNPDEFEPAPFHLYDTQVARVKAEKALEHIAASRWSEALAELQGLIEEHRGEVLAAERPQPEGARTPSQTDVHAGAGTWAVSQLFSLPEEGKRLYRERFGPRAKDNLRRAIAASDRGALARVARRWPLTPAAERAWWALGDLEIELGHAADGVRAWGRAAAIHVGEPMRTTITLEEWRALRTDVASLADEDSHVGALARLDLALALNESIGESGGTRKETEASFITGPALGIAAESLVITAPFAGAAATEAPDGWESSFRLPRSPFSNVRHSSPSRLFPVRLGDTIFVNTSRSVHAIDAFDGQEKWSMSEARVGWDALSDREEGEFEEAIDKAEHIVSLSASRGVVVAPIQIPWIYQESDQYNDLKIIEVIPERRLIALDAETGKELWNTLPPKNWDGDSGSFAESMTVVGPPTIVGARVLVPMAKLRGRIELHLGCFDLATGRVLWSAPLVTGQRSLNMFGRANTEFSAPPAVVVGDTAIMLTQLGIVAAVDIFTGETRWDTVYNQVSIRAPEYFQPGWLDNRWRNAPPVITGSTLIAAPFDGKSMFALDIESGSMLWSVDQRRLSMNAGVEVVRRGRRPSGGLDVVLGANERQIILGGSAVASIEFPDGVRNGPPYARHWVWPTGSTTALSSGIPVLDDERLFVPAGQRIVAIERDTGLVVEEIQGSLGTGNLLVSDGMLFSLNGSQLDARFQWSAMVERARDAIAGVDATLDDAATLVRLLVERAALTVGRGGPVRKAVVLLDEAGDVIQNKAAPLPGSSAAADSLRADLFEVQILRGQAERLRGDVNAARSATQLARSLATDETQERRALLTLHGIERTRDQEARMVVLKELQGRRHRHAMIGVRAELARVRWSGSAELGAVLEALDRGEDPEAAWNDPWNGPIFATDAMASPSRRGAFPKVGELQQGRMDCGLFALISEVEVARSLPRGSEASLGKELEALHTVLQEFPSERIFGGPTRPTSGQWARARIRALRVTYPLSPAFERFEYEAEALLTAAIARAKADGGSTTLLDAIPSLFPGSMAAERASDARIEVALESGSAADVAQIVVDSLASNWHPARTSVREAELLAQLGATLGAEGNTALKVGLIENLARYSPTLKIRVPEPKGSGAPGAEAAAEAAAGAAAGAASAEGPATVTLSELRDQWRAQRAEAKGGPRAKDQGFTSSIIKRDEFKGEFTLVEKGEVEAFGEVAFFASRTRLMAFASGNNGAPLWQRPESLPLATSNRPRRVELCDGGWLVIQRNDQVACIDAATGDELWTFRQPNRTIGRIAVSGGMVVVMTAHASSRQLADVYGIDVVKGLELWRLEPIGSNYHQTLLIDSGRVVMLPQGQSRAAVHDLYTGHPVAAIQTGKLRERIALYSWADGGHLVVPHLDGARSQDQANAIVAYDLNDGSEAWKVDLDRHPGGMKNLLGVIDMPAEEGSDERVRIALLESAEQGQRSSGLTQPPYDLHILNERLGALDQRPLASIDSGTRLVGIRNHKREVIETPLLIALVRGNARRQPTIRAIHPKLGRIWEVLAPGNLRMTAASGLPEPALGGGTLALMVSENVGSSTRSTRPAMRLMFLDAPSGSLLESRGFPSAAETAAPREIASFGSSLATCAKRIMEIME